MSSEITDDEIVDQLRGTCVSESEAAESLNVSVERIQEAIQRSGDDIFLCELCGWWCESSELAKDSSCTDCCDVENEDSDEDE
jgi:hypothetical protein